MSCTRARYVPLALTALALAGVIPLPCAAQSPRDAIKERIRERREGQAAEKTPTNGDQPAAKTQATAGTQQRKLEHAGATRTYLLHLPAKRERGQAVPLVLVLHGAGADGRITEALTGFSPLADQHHFAVAYPDGENRIWRYWEGAAGGKIAKLKGDDLGFLAKLITTLVEEGVADRRRVSVTGISNGAYMANRLACDFSDRIAAIAPIAGTLPKRMSETLKPRRPMPVLYMHGTDDPLVHIDGSDRFTKRELSLSADALVEWWAKHNGCVDKPTLEKLADKSDDGTTVERRTFAANKDGAPVVYYKVQGGGHTWPGGKMQPEALLGKTSRDINASELIWEFFAKHPLPKSRP